MKLDDPVQFVKGVGPRRSEMLANSGIETVEDLLYHLPFRYEDRRRVITSDQVQRGNDATLVGRIGKVRQRPLRGRGRSLLEAVFEDDGGRLGLVWFHQAAYFKKRLEAAERWLVHGRVESARGGGLQMVHPEIEPLEGEVEEAARIVPVYQKPTDLPLAAMRRIVGAAVDGAAGQATSAVPAPLRERLGLMSPARALVDVHSPSRDVDPGDLARFATPAHRSLIFEELFGLQVGMRLRKRRRAEERGAVIPESEERVKGFLATLAFSPTAAQSRSAAEIAVDLAGAAPMNRLLHGDVGSGKTLVAFTAVIRAASASYQSAVMAPTELLAEQHFETMRPWAEALGIRIALLSGTLRAAAAAGVREGLAGGHIDLVVGTHALVQQSTSFARLGLAVVDEQHRFGVMQRAALGAGEVNTLLLSATPIPRTLALALYGDVEVSVLDEMPPGRRPVVTRVLEESSRERLFERMGRAMSEGRRCYMVYPLVEESEKLDLNAATSMATELQTGVFRNHRVALVHGRMRSTDRDDVMRRFVDREIDVLVATTVIEVGVDVANASVILVEHAERFGLAQLHQLRGRVGRGPYPSSCFLIHAEPLSALAAARLTALEHSTDGFELAERDLVLRGPGDFLGTRQSGAPMLEVGDLIRDLPIVVEARRAALAWVGGSAEPHVVMGSIRHAWAQRFGLLDVG